jgi:hypothetical protein
MLLRLKRIFTIIIIIINDSFTTTTRDSPMTPYVKKMLVMIERISYATDKRVSACGDSMAITNNQTRTHTHTHMFIYVGEEVIIVAFCTVSTRGLRIDIPPNLDKSTLSFHFCYRSGIRIWTGYQVISALLFLFFTAWHQ